MESKKQQKASLSKSYDNPTPMKTLAQFDSNILVGTLVWGKFKDWPWWPGVIVTNADVGWSISKKKNSYCILWLGPNKTASRISAVKLSDFLDQNLNRLMDQPIGVEQEEAICEALQGLMSQVLDDKELEGNLSFQEMKSLAVQTEIEREEVNGRKQVVLESTSNWFKRAIDSLRSVGAVKKESSPSTTEIDPQGLITSDYAEFAVSAINSSAIKQTEEEPTPPPPRKKKALLVLSQSETNKLQCRKGSNENHCSKPGWICGDLLRKRKVPSERFSEFHLMDKEADRPSSKKVSKKFADRGALNNKSDAVGDAFKMRKFLQDEKFLRLKLPKLVEEEKMRASDDDVDLTIRTSGGHRKIQLVAWIRFRSLYQSGKIHIRVCSCYRSSPIILVMKPTDVVAAYDDTDDILDLRNEPDLSDVVKKLLDPPEETGLYAFLLCDGLNWRLIGNFNPESLTHPLLKPEEVALKSLPVPSSSREGKRPRNQIALATMPEVILEEYYLSDEEYKLELNTSEKQL